MNLSVEDDDYPHARAVLIAYLMHKASVCDWHGVRDCAVDIELMEARHSAQKKFDCVRKV